MRRYPEATPCPAPIASFASNPYREHGRRSSIYAPSFAADDTTTMNLEYTTELQPNLRKAKPRRPVRGARMPTFNPSLDIFEDVAQEEEQQQEVANFKRKSRTSIMPEGRVDKRSTILAHPAQKVHIAPLAPREPQLQKPHRRRVSQILLDKREMDVNATMQLKEDVLEQRDLKEQGPRKDPRRRTIYIPSDDTTIVTIHPGQAMQRSRNPREPSPDLGLELVTLSEEEPDNLLPALKKVNRTSRKSLAMPPKRAPLQHSSRTLQSVSFAEDIYGANTGKENIPPGSEAVASKGSRDKHVIGKSETKKSTAKPVRVQFTTSKSVQAGPRQLHSKSDTGHKRLRSQLSYDGSPAKSIKAKADETASARPRPSIKAAIKSHLEKSGRAPLSSSPFHMDRSPPTALRRKREGQAPTKISMMHVVGEPQGLKEKYPVLSEDLARPELYEDHWLTYQEVAITQLLNSLFVTTDEDADNDLSPEDLRKKLLAMYHEPSIPLLYKRLQASLLYGALSVPKDLLAQTLRLKDDVGLRKKFLNLWVKTYDLTSLRAAAEAVIGRQITVPSRLSSGSTSSDDGSRLFRAERRAVEAFLDAFLIRNEDAVRVKGGAGSIASIARGDHSGDDFGSQGWAWRRTVIRSLMILLLLDKAKTAGTVQGCLFQTSSPHKTSTDVLHALASMLFPSLGDVSRPLGHLNYKVEHAQYPLQEYTYKIENIAIDLRDGIILTRLVELLLYSPSSLMAQCDESVTITLPTGDVLTSTFDVAQKESWVLSQHLKFPAIGRAQKLYNVQIALSALTGVRGIPVQAVGGIKADDVVNGHREKTLSLLWSLVGKCGLGTLVDWTHLTKEIERFREQWYSKRDNYDQRDLDSDDDESIAELDGVEYHKRLLLQWSRSIARLQGIRVSNLTTSFSNSRALEAIVDTYLPSSLALSTDGQYRLSLAAKLKATGCSSSFIALFTPQITTAKSIPSKDFTLLSLAFLASRLLPLSITHRAAAVIQRVYRLHLARRTARQRITLMRLAHDCAAVAQTREQLVNAAIVIQKRWKTILEARQTCLLADVERFQALARGWAIRRWVRRFTNGRIGGKEKARRARGGW
ncbi:hypothetical protein EJ04DRAFT_541644 [Polyplosphaeria fusca]|uniref:Calponin-homology (CH) domain-containing protein n=1 Tax=Polyplosphaeria fusca TaxID=682080 RepID=A0A9P4R3D4_9PLEO|nr:hypothetical protein EJ04DRAFT_541644 [Polyplosphaeria fusca]